VISSARRASAKSHRACPRLGSCNLDLPFRWAEPVLITPRLHRVHHVPAATNRNFGHRAVDLGRVAGTLVVADTALQVPVGVPGGLDTYPRRFPDAMRQPYVNSGPRPGTGSGSPATSSRQRSGGGRSGRRREVALTTSSQPEVKTLSAKGGPPATSTRARSPVARAAWTTASWGTLPPRAPRAPPATPSGPRLPLHGSDACGAAGATRRGSPATTRRRRPWWLGRARQSRDHATDRRRGHRPRCSKL
jgi:hypothetical protein